MSTRYISRGSRPKCTLLYRPSLYEIIHTCLVHRILVTVEIVRPPTRYMFGRIVFIAFLSQTNPMADMFLRRFSKRKQCNFFSLNVFV